MSKPQIGCDEWMEANPGRYAIYPHPWSGWHITRDMVHIDSSDTLPEAVDAAYADAEARAALVPSC